jgi:hypothetical protein
VLQSCDDGTSWERAKPGAAFAWVVRPAAEVPVEDRPRHVSFEAMEAGLQPAAWFAPALARFQYRPTTSRSVSMSFSTRFESGRVLGSRAANAPDIRN